MDGVVFDGDWQDKKFSPVKKGDELFKVGRKDSFRLEMSVPERDIQDVKAGAKGYLGTNSLPNDPRPFKVERIIPLPQAKTGENVFVVYGVPEKLDPTWRE